MNQIDYSDINKFLTSIGLIIVGIAFLIPWYLNQNLNLLIIKQKDIDNTTEAARTILMKQQKYVLFISDYLPYIVASLLLIGIVFICIGLFRWNKRQIVLNGIQDEEWKSRKKENMSIDDKRDQISQELPKIPEPERESAVNKYLEIEENIYLKLAQFYKVNYIPQHNIRIGQFEYDVILTSKYIQKRADVILEIKYFTTSIPQERILEQTRKFLMAITNYEQTQQRFGTLAVLLLLFDSEDALVKTENFKTNILELAHSTGIHNVRAIFRLRDDISQLQANKLFED